MHQQVALEIPRGHKALVTLGTLMGPLTCMNALVHCKVSWLTESLPTFITGIWLETLMGSLMPAEAGRIAEHAPTLWAKERFLSRVGALVALEG